MTVKQKDKWVKQKGPLSEGRTALLRNMFPSKIPSRDTLRLRDATSLRDTGSLNMDLAAKSILIHNTFIQAPTLYQALC